MEKERGEGENSNSTLLERIPMGSRSDDFCNRPVMWKSNGNISYNRGPRSFPSSEQYHLDYINRTTRTSPPTCHDAPIGSLLLPRRIPIKIDPRVQLANERTFLLWMHSSLWLFGSAFTILRFAERSEGNDDGGGTISLDHHHFTRLTNAALILPLSLAFIGYAIHQYNCRTIMIKERSPGPYEDILGPTLLALLLMVAILLQFLWKALSISYF